MSAKKKNPNQHNDLRDIFLERMEEFLDDKAMIAEIEDSVYRKTYEETEENGMVCSWRTQFFVNSYLSNSRRILCAFDEDSHSYNPYLVSKIMEGEIKPADICFLTLEQENPESWNMFIEKRNKSEEQNMEAKKEKATRTHCCGNHKCKSMNTTHYLEIKRSIDEGSNIVVKCLDCGFKYSQS